MIRAMTVTRPFFGRHDVLAKLQSHLDAVTRSGSGRLVAVRGRRQVGKSSAIERFVQHGSTPYVFVTGVFQASSTTQLNDATSAINESTHPLPDAELLTQTPARSWREWLGRLAVAARSGPIIVILDEFPWLTEGDRSLEGELQAQWDRVLERLPILLILVGSDVAIMDQLTTHGRPLFGRISPIVVPALNPAEVAEAAPDLDAVDVFDAYLITGGYPRLVTDFADQSGQSGQTGQTAIRYAELALGDLYSPLITTARLSLDAEFPEPQYAYRVLSAIGSSDVAKPGFTDVLGETADAAERKRAETATTRALRLLTDTKGLIEREVPAWAAPSSRLRRYRITDPYLRFWFRYIESNVERIARGRTDLAVAALRRDWASWRGLAIEPIVREALARLAVSDPHLTGVEAVRPWWTRDNSVEVDVVAQTAESSALVGTIKWRTSGTVSEREIAQLRRHRQRVPRSETALLAAISPTAGIPRGADVGYCADDLLGAWRTG